MLRGLHPEDHRAPRYSKATTPRSGSGTLHLGCFAELSPSCSPRGARSALTLRGLFALGRHGRQKDHAGFHPAACTLALLDARGPHTNFRPVASLSLIVLAKRSTQGGSPAAFSPSVVMFAKGITRCFRPAAFALALLDASRIRQAFTPRLSLSFFISPRGPQRLSPSRFSLAMLAIVSIGGLAGGVEAGSCKDLAYNIRSQGGSAGC